MVNIGNEKAPENSLPFLNINVENAYGDAQPNMSKYVSKFANQIGLEKKLKFIERMKLLEQKARITKLIAALEPDMLKTKEEQTSPSQLTTP